MSTARAQIVIGADSDAAAKGIGKLDQNIEKFGKSVTAAGTSLTKYITLPLIALGATVIKFGADFDKAMTQSLAIMGDVSDGMRKDMEAAARSVAKTTAFSAKEAADSYFFLASAGLSAVASIEALPRVAAFAQAGAFDMARATDLLTDAQSALGLAVDDTAQNIANMTRVSDVLVKANTLANASVEEFSEALTNKAGAALRLLNKDIEEGMAVLAVFADQGLKGAAAGEALNIVMRDLQRTSIDNKELFEEMNIAVYDSEGNMRSMVDIIRDLENAFDGMSDEQLRTTLMLLGFQDRSVSSMMALLGLSDQIEDYENQLREAAGTTEEVANEQLQNFWDQLGLVKDQLIDVGLSLWELGQPILMETVIPALEEMVGYVELAVAWFEALEEKTQKQMVGALGLAAALGPVLIIVGKLISVIGALGIKFVLIAALIGGLIAVLVKLWNENEDFRDAVIEIWETIQAKAKEIWEKIKQFWEENGQAIIDKAMVIWTEVEEIFTELWAALEDVFGEILKTAQFLFEKIKEFWAMYGEDILKDLRVVWTVIKDIIITAINLIKDVIGLVLALIRGDWEEAGKRITSIVSGLWEWLLRFFNQMAEILGRNLGKALGAMVDGFRQLGTRLLDSIKNLPQAFKNVGINLIKSIANGIKESTRFVTEAIANTAKAIRNFLPFSPAKEGPLKDLDKLDFGGPMVKSMQSALPKVQGMMNDLMTPGLSLQAAGGSFESHREIYIEVPVNVNGREFARATARDMDNEFYKLGRR